MPHPLSVSDNGVKTATWLRIRASDAEAFRLLRRTSSGILLAKKITRFTKEGRTYPLTMAFERVAHDELD